MLALLALLAGCASAQPYTGEAFEELIAAQDTVLQRQLEAVYPDTAGYLITGPLDPLFTGDSYVKDLLGKLRVVCPDMGHMQSAIEILKASAGIRIRRMNFGADASKKNSPGGFRGNSVSLVSDGNEKTILILTFQQLRWLSWARESFENVAASDSLKSLYRYALKVADYLDQIDAGAMSAVAPRAIDYGLSERVDIFAPPPDYVIQGYENYKSFIDSHAELSTDFAHGVLAFVPSDSTLARMKHKAPNEAFPNKEAPMFQNECRKFFDRDGDLRQVKTLTPDQFRKLDPGEYFFGVGLDGTIRFGKELLREEVERIEKETGRKLARANHSFLFANEPLLTAGAFFIERDTASQFSRVTAQSGHYFYSNVSATIRDDIAIKSDYYLTSLGHFFLALDRLGIPYSGVLISKF